MIPSNPTGDKNEMDDRRHYEVLQTARGIAALIVVVHHCVYTFQTSGWANHAALLSANVAHAAVVFFFVLSGFVLTLSLRHKQATVGALLDFYVRRAWRIYPALWFATALGLIHASFVHSHLDTSVVREWFSSRYTPDHRTAFQVAFAFAGARPYIVPPSWSIFVELVGSAMIPFLAFLLQRLTGLFGLVLAGLVALSFFYKGPVGMGLYLVDFAIGSLLVYLLPSVTRAFASRAVGFVVAIGALVYMALVRSDQPARHLILSACAAALVCVLLSRPHWQTLENRALVRLGDISYSIYILHFPIMSMATVAVSHVATTGNGAALLLSVSTLAIVLPLSELSYRWVEKPGIRVGKAFSRRLFHREAARASTGQQTARSSAGSASRDA